jgi:magnesium chelatase family protein
LEFDELSRRSGAESSAQIKKRVDAARKIQRERFNGAGFDCNAYMDPNQMEAYCNLSPECSELMRRAFDSLGLTARSYDRILRVARTIADLDGAADISPGHLAEAVQYRTFDFREDGENGA